MTGPLILYSHKVDKLQMKHQTVLHFSLQLYYCPDFITAPMDFAVTITIRIVMCLCCGCTESLHLRRFFYLAFITLYLVL